MLNNRKAHILKFKEVSPMMYIKTALLLGLWVSGAVASASSIDDAKIYNIQLTINHGNTVASKFTLNVLNGLLAAGSTIDSGYPVEKRIINSSDEKKASINISDYSSGVIYTVKPVIQKDKGTLEVKLSDSLDVSKDSTTNQAEINTLHFSKTIPVTLGKTTTESIGFIRANGKDNPVTLTVLIEEPETKQQR
jgi:hypothetical protein